MKSQTLESLFVAVWLTVAAQAMAEEAVQLVVVPVDKEPRHRLAFEDQYKRVFDVRIAPGDTTLYQSHQRDSIYIPISAPPNLLNQELGKAAKPLPIKPGDVAFGEHSKASFSHRVSNLSDEEFHVIDVEIIAESASSNSTIGSLPEGHQSVLENARVRVSRIVLEPGQAFVNASNGASPRLIVVLAGSRIGIASDSATDVTPGQFYRSDDSVSQRIRNKGSDRVELLNVEIK